MGEEDISFDIHGESGFWFHLSFVPGIGYMGAKQLKEAALQKQVPLSGQMNQQLWQKLNLDSSLVEVLSKTYERRKEQGINWLNNGQHRWIITPNNPKYPTALLNIASPPMVLYVEGNLEILNQRQIALVGSRAPSHQGKQIAKFITQALCEYDWVINSGLALGVDGICHQQTLDSHGRTVGVLGCGIDEIYPMRHKSLSERILNNNGTLLSEFTPGVKPKPEHFPRRNRIISGMSKGVVVVEAAIKSGSLISARYAAEQGKEVFAIPGNIFNPLSAGCHWLIQQGAKLVTCVEDINEEFQSLNITLKQTDKKKFEKKVSKTLASSQLLDSVDYEVTSLDKVTQRTGLPVTSVMAELLEYELQGLVASVQGGYIKLRGN
jgi:DNA processing protein